MKKRCDSATPSTPSTTHRPWSVNHFLDVPATLSRALENLVRRDPVHDHLVVGAGGAEWVGRCLLLVRPPRRGAHPCRRDPGDGALTPAAAQDSGAPVRMATHP